MNLNSIITSWLIWFLLGIGLAFLELYLPGFIVLFLGIGCWVTAGALLLWDLSLTQQILIFITSAVVSLLLLRKWLIGVFRGVSPDRQDENFDDFPRGMHVKVLKTITPADYGRIQYRGTSWYAAAEETIEEGETVEVIRYADNSRQVFFVRRVNQP